MPDIWSELGAKPFGAPASTLPLPKAADTDWAKLGAKPVGQWQASSIATPPAEQIPAGESLAVPAPILPDTTSPVARFRRDQSMGGAVVPTVDVTPAEPQSALRDAETLQGIMGPAGFVLSPIIGPLRMAEGVKQVAGAGTADEVMSGVAKVGGGAMETGLLALPGAAAARPLETALALGVGIPAGAATEKALEILDAPKGAQELGGVIGTVLGGGFAAAGPRLMGNAIFKAKLKSYLQEKLNADYQARAAGQKFDEQMNTPQAKRLQAAKEDLRKTGSDIIDAEFEDLGAVPLNGKKAIAAPKVAGPKAAPQPAPVEPTPPKSELKRTETNKSEVAEAPLSTPETRATSGASDEEVRAANITQPEWVAMNRIQRTERVSFREAFARVIAQRPTTPVETAPTEVAVPGPVASNEGAKGEVAPAQAPQVVETPTQEIVQEKSPEVQTAPSRKAPGYAETSPEQYSDKIGQLINDIKGNIYLTPKQKMAEINGLQNRLNTFIELKQEDLEAQAPTPARVETTQPAVQPATPNPVTPQVPNEPGTKYVLPTFATGQQSQPPVRRATTEQLTAALDVANETGNVPAAEEAKAELEHRDPDLNTRKVVYTGDGYKIRGSDGEPSGETFKTEGEALRQLTQPKVPAAVHPKTPELLAALRERIESGQGFKGGTELQRFVKEKLGASVAEGGFEMKDAYDYVETAINQHIAEKLGPELLKKPFPEAVKALEDLTGKMATQTVRTKEQKDFQQFSTPPALSMLTAVAADIKPGETVLEPSAGTGSLAAWAKAAGGKVETNELAPRRKALLELSGYTPTGHNAERIRDMRPDLKPDVVIMNPPFSASAGRLSKNANAIGYQHVLSALKATKPGGRVVAILGEGARLDAPNARAFWSGLTKEGATVRANVGMSGENYKKYGTTFGNRLIVIDKVPPVKGVGPVTGDFNTIEEIHNAIEPIIARSAAGRSVEPVGERPGQVAPVRREPQGTGESGVGVSGQPGRSGHSVEQLREPGSKAGAATAPEGGAARQPLETPRGETPGRGTGASVNADVRGGQPASAGTSTRPAAGQPELNIETSTKGAPREAVEQEGAYETYRPSKIRAGISHEKATGTALVETGNMAAVEPPDVTYKPSLPQDIIDSGKISDAQLESIIYAGQAHSVVLEGGNRAGYMNGDGTGVGKGTIASGIVLDNWNKGRKKALWVSLKPTLIKQAQRDLDWIKSGIKAKVVNDWGFADKIDHDGVVFASYAMLHQVSSDASIQTRLEQIMKWKPDVIIFDESHTAKNAVGSEVYDENDQGEQKGKKNLLSSEGTKAGAAVLGLDKGLPDSRIAYFSATAFTNVRNLGYANRLGLWGPGTQFPTFKNFLVEIEKGDLGAMELVAREMKAQGRYTARQISFKGVDFREETAALTPGQKVMYDAGVAAWQEILKNIDAAIDATAGEDGKARGLAKSRALKEFWGRNQRFYRQILVTMKVPTVIREIEKALKDNKSVFIDLVSTGEAEAQRQLASGLANDTDFADLDMSAKQMMISYLDKAFPIYLWEDYVDENGVKQARPILDEKGDKVESEEAKAIRDQLKADLEKIKLPKAPMDELIDHFGVDAVAEVSGRKSRIVEDPKTGKPVEVKRVKPKGATARDVNEWERSNFMEGRKRIAIASGAGGTGFDFHADKRVANQQRRVHITIEPSWSADQQMQKFGRTHRTNQAVPPEYVLVATDLGGEKRFISAIASRLASLGALTRGERRAGGASEILGKYNLESEYGQAAVNAVLNQFEYNSNVAGVGDVAVSLPPMPVELADLGKAHVKEELLGLKGKDTAPVGQFLNRVLNLPTSVQALTFDHFMNVFEKIVTQVKEAGAYDEGTIQLKALNTRIKSDEVIRKTGAIPTRHVVVDAELPVDYVSWRDAYAHMNSHPTLIGGLLRNKRGGQLWAVRRSSQDHMDAVTGQMVPMAIAVGTRAGQRKTFPWADVGSDNYERVSGPEKAWNDEIAKLPKMEREDVHLITGSVLGVWKTLTENAEGRKIPVVSVRGEGGEPITGIRLPEKTAADIVAMLSGKADYSAKSIFDRAWNQGQAIELSGARLQRTRMFGEPALTVTAGSPQAQATLRGLGLQSQEIAAGTRFYIPISAEPTDAQIADVTATLEKVLKQFPPKTAKPNPERGSAPMLTDLADWLKNKFSKDDAKINYSGLGAIQDPLIRNLSQLEKASQPAHLAAIRAASSVGQARTILTAAVPAINKALHGSEFEFPELRLALIESRLRGIRERWQNFSDQVLSMDGDQLQEAYNDQFSQLLDALEGKKGLPQDIAQTAAALVESKDWEATRAFLHETFADAARGVAQIMDPEWFDAVTNDSHVKEALRIYKDLVEKPMAENHALNEGVFSNALGPLDTYYPLIATSRVIQHGPGRRLPYRKPKNAANFFATGLSEGYNATMEGLRDRLASAVRANDKAALIQSLADAGLLRKLAKKPATGEEKVIKFRGTEYEAEPVELSPDRIIIENGKPKHVAASRGLVPRWLARELRPILERDQWGSKNALDVVSKILNTAALSGPADAVFHARNLLGTMVANTPFLDNSLLGKTIGNLPIAKTFFAIYKAATTNPLSEESAADLIEMAKVGVVPDRYASTTYSRRIAKELGAEVKPPFVFGPLLYGPKGFDIRARLVMWRVAKQIAPNAKPAELHRFVNQLGNYVPALQGEIERAVKRSGMSPFYTAGSTMFRNGVNAWLGRSPLPGAGRTLRIRSLLTNGAIGTLAVWIALYKYLTGKLPWEDNRSKLLQIPVPPRLRQSALGQQLWGKGNEVGYISLSFFDPILMRGSRALGIAGAYENRMLGGAAGQMGEAAQRDMMNSLAHPLFGPIPRAAFAAAFGADPYITSFRDYSGRIAPNFFPAIPPKTAAGWPSVGRRAFAAGAELNAFYGSLAESTGMLGESKGEKGNQYLRMVVDFGLPGLVADPSDPFKRADTLRRQRQNIR